jgi:phage-related minor tail protein
LQQSADGAGLALRLDTSRIRADLDDLTQLGERFGRTITSAFARGIVSGRKFSTILRSVMQRLTSQALTAAIRPLGNLISGSLGSLLGGITANAQGNLLSQGRVTPFAAGGIVNSPTMFAMRGGTGLMGEAGPEAIMPLARGRDGKLGVRSAGGASPVTVNMTVVTHDADSFQRSQGQVTAAVLRALSRGQRHL